MSSILNIVSVQLLDNPAKPDAPFRMEITFEVFEAIKDDVEWELVFVATDGKEENDQVLDSVLIGPIRDGRHKFIFEAPAPNLQKLQAEDLMDVTVLLLKCKYHDQLFNKIAWFITHTYTEPELIDNPPDQPIIEKMERTVITEDLRVTSYPIKWDDADEISDEAEKLNIEDEQEQEENIEADREDEGIQADQQVDQVDNNGQAASDDQQNSLPVPVEQPISSGLTQSVEKMEMEGPVVTDDVRVLSTVNS
jgi:histone chaperone ASF1